MASQEKTVILVDFFDTLMFRHVTVVRALHQWAVCLKQKYNGIACEAETGIISSRKKAFALARHNKQDPTFDEAMAVFYGMYPALQRETSMVEFVNTAGQLDKAVEYGCQYPNKKLIQNLVSYKKQGKKICIVSDYYWGADTLRSFLGNANIDEDLFENIFVSCDCGCSKASGMLYAYVQQALDTAPDYMQMIGDNPHSDSINARKAGIQSKLERHIFHKGMHRIRHVLGLDFCQKQMKCVASACYQNGKPFSEYITAFYTFTRDLYSSMKINGVGKAAFMAREGYFLQRLYERYQQLCVPAEAQIEPLYLRCSRRSVFAGVDEGQRPDVIQEPISIRNWLKSVDLTVDDARQYVSMTDEEADEAKPLVESEVYKALSGHHEFSKLYHSIIQKNKRAFTNYLDGFMDNGQLNVVDSGWLGTTQLALKNYYGVSSVGYYIGTQKLENCPNGVERHGLLFEEPDSPYYDYVGMNFPFYQELLAAPHGSAIRYIENENGSIDVVEKWDETEKLLYENRILKLQGQMITLFDGLCAWNIVPHPKEKWIVAKTIFHSNMFAYGERFRFICDCENSFFVNFRQEKKGAKNYDYREVKLGLDIIWKPEKYIRYFTKIQRSTLYKKKVVRMLYPPVARCYYAYVLVLQRIKNLLY